MTSTGSTGASKAQYQLLSARSDASQAQRAASALEARADQAQRSADQEQARAQGLSVQASAAGERADMARRTLASLESSLQRGGPTFGSGERAGARVNTYA